MGFLIGLNELVIVDDKNCDFCRDVGGGENVGELVDWVQTLTAAVGFSGGSGEVGGGGVNLDAKLGRTVEGRAVEVDDVDGRAETAGGKDSA